MLNKSQVSVEYLMIVGFAFVMTIPLLIIYYTYTSESSDRVATTQALGIARDIVDSAESVYYLGKPSQTTMKLSFPDKIRSITISNREIVIKVSTNYGIADVVQVSTVNITGSLPTSQGLYTVLVKAQDGYVQVSAT